MVKGIMRVRPSSGNMPAHLITKGLGAKSSPAAQNDLRKKVNDAYSAAAADPQGRHPFRDRIFRELSRVLKPGGRVYAAELLLKEPELTPQVCGLDDWFS